MNNYLFAKYAFVVLACIFLSVPVNAQTPGKRSGFKKYTLSSGFKSEGVATADVNKDGKMDVIAGPEWFEAPGWKIHHIYESKAYNPAKEYCTSFLNITLDVNFDSWDDLIVVGFPGEPGYWYENPKNKEGYWKKHVFLPEVGIGNESPAFIDMDGDGRLDILCTDSKANQLVWLQAPVHKNDTSWHRYPISKADPVHQKFSHGIGSGDLNKDGRKDIFTKIGWWEAPLNPKQPDWKFHSGPLSEDCSQMHALDVDSDGLTDLLSASAHKRGIWWHQQSKDINGSIAFATREISKLFTQSHASLLTDINGDGHPDLLSGKRFFAHNDSDIDPGTHDPAVLYWFQNTPGKAPYFTPRLVDSNSGAGLQIVATDLNADRRTDIIIANKKGVFYFKNRMKL